MKRLATCTCLYDVLVEKRLSGTLMPGEDVEGV